MADSGQRGAAAGVTVAGSSKVDSIFRVIGAERLINAENARLTAAVNPQKFHEDRMKAIKDLQGKVERYYEERRAEYEKLGYSEDDIKRFAKVDAEEYFKMAMIPIDREYPTQFMSSAINAVQSEKTETARRFRSTYAATGSTYRSGGGYKYKRRAPAKKRAASKK